MMYKTRSEIRLEALETLDRPLTEEESEELRRVLHAVYCRNLRLIRAARAEREMRAKVLREHEAENAKILRRLEREAKRP